MRDYDHGLTSADTLPGVRGRARRLLRGSLPIRGAFAFRDSRTPGRRLLLTGLCLLLPIGVAGCRILPAAVPQSSASASPTASAELPGKPAPKTKAEVQQRATEATLELTGDFHPDTAKPTSDKASVWKLSYPCSDTALPSDRKRSAGYERVWDGDEVMVRHYTVGYLNVAGKKLLSELRAIVKTCTSYKSPDGRMAGMLDPAEVTVPGTDDGYQWCERLQGDGTVYWCTTMLARGNFVTEINNSHSSQAEARKVQDELLKSAAEAFVAAV